jgi:cellobiose phosphorylase
MPTSINATPPLLALLSNDRYSVMITAAGAGSSTWRGLDVTRWREDATRDCWGQFCYVRDLPGGVVWSVGHQPLCGRTTECASSLYADRAEFRRRDGDIETRWSICVDPAADAEVRAITMVNRGSRPHDLDLTSYAEVCLNHRGADRAHPAFAKLFLETEFDHATGALLARRRPRGATETPVFAVHLSASDDAVNEAIDYETDRVRFLGRGRTPACPAALDDRAELSRTTGPVLDPVFSLRRRLRLDPGATARIAFITGAADSRQEAIAIATRYRDYAEVERAFTDANARCNKLLGELSLTPEDIALFNRLAGAVVFSSATPRDRDAVEKNRLGQPGLWPHAISGDLPIVLVRVGADPDESLVRELIPWHSYVRRCGLECDLVILVERGADAAKRLAEELQSGPEGEKIGKPGGLFLIDAATIPPEDAQLFGAAARAVLGGGRGRLIDHVNVPVADRPVPPQLERQSRVHDDLTGQPVAPSEELLSWNGLGGFSRDGREYVVRVDGTRAGNPSLPPAPWINVLANPNFGCLVSEGGLGYTWAGNSQMNRLTPWSNDPVSDVPGEVIYLRDEMTGDVWTPTPLPLGTRAVVTVRHGQGYTSYAHRSRGMDQELSVFVPPDDPVKVLLLRLHNAGNQKRKLTAIYYAELVLGTVRENAAMQVVSERDAETGAILARNAWAGAFASARAFVAAGQPVRSATADRTEFLGRNGSVASPAALHRTDLAGRFGPALDPCAALLTELTLDPGQTQEVLFVIGQAEGLEQIRGLVARYTDSDRATVARSEVGRQWDRILDSIQVTTPDVALNLMLNRWLLYQVLACRVWARSAYYQSGGAYGFRDQLQDVMALVYSAPKEARDQILRAAGRQFEEGDVQHWWHPPSGVGVRTRITDDLYFLPFVVHHYVSITGDVAVLDESVPFIKSPVLREEQEEDFGQPAVSAESASVYEHCVRALVKGYQLGGHGLPLMGTGDWNDGMNKVGAKGKGESVWNGWFFVTVLRAFAETAKGRGDEERYAWCQDRAEALRAALEANAWDGSWYRRAYFDDGTPLGSAQNQECQIDAIPQAWANISGVADPERTASAMSAVEQRLVRRRDKLIQLFDPPFDKGTLQPGYIKGYVPGIRENGGQYTHAAVWVVLATALQGDGDRAVELWNLINPVYHATTPAEVQQYKVEPYVVCADIYGAAPHTGRGGWTWYTGSASWLYRVALEAILGFRLEGNALRFAPCVPKAWPGYEVRYRHGTATYRIRVDNAAGRGQGVRTIRCDGQVIAGKVVTLADDGRTHTVEVELG